MEKTQHPLSSDALGIQLTEVKEKIKDLKAILRNPGVIGIVIATDTEEFELTLSNGSSDVELAPKQVITSALFALLHELKERKKAIKQELSSRGYDMGCRAGSGE